MLTTLANVKLYLSATSTANDELITMLIGAVSAWFCAETGRDFVDQTTGEVVAPADVALACTEMVALKFNERKSVGASSVSMSGQSVSLLPSIVPSSVQRVVDAHRRWSV